MRVDHRREILGTAEVSGDVERRSACRRRRRSRDRSPDRERRFRRSALPNAGSLPLVGVRPRASSGACLTDGAVVGLTVRAFGSGTVISGVFAAGARTASRLGGSSGGVTACTGRPPSAVMPPFSGPALPLSEIVITVGGTSWRGNRPPRPTIDQRGHRQMHGDRHRDHLLQPRGRRASDRGECR